MPLAEYVVIMEDQELSSQFKASSWNGAAAGAEVSEPGNGKPVKQARTVRVQAESVAEAINGAKQVFPGFVGGTTYGVLKSSLTTG
jgi:hypothetical protein